MLNETNAACSRILLQFALSTAAGPPSASDGSSGNTVRPDSIKAELARAAIKEGAQKLVLAMVDQVRKIYETAFEHNVVDLARTHSEGNKLTCLSDTANFSSS